MEEQVRYDLPEGWVWTTLEKVCYKITDGSHNPPPKQDTGIPMLSARNIENYTINFEKDVRYINDEDYLREKQRTNIEQGDVLLTIVGTIGRVSIVEQEQKFAIQRSVALLKPILIYSKYLMYYLSSPFCQKILITNSKGSAQKGIYLSALKNINIPITHLAEQQTIVSYIETLFTKSDESENVLKNATNSLKIYRQALLSDAFAGKLTNKNIPKGKLPNGWKVVKISTIANVVRGGSPRPAGDLRYYDGNIPFLKVKDLTNDDNVHLSTFEYTIKEAGLLKTRRIKPKTLLLTNSGSTLGIPKICLIDATINDGIAAFLDLDERSIYYLYYYLLLNTQKLRDISMGATQPNLNTMIIKNIELPYCSFEEQRKVVEIIESRFTLVDNLEKTIDNVLNEIIALKHSILKKAFEGRLVNYTSKESVEKLLDDIKEEKKLYLENQKQLSGSKSKQKKKMEEKKSILDILMESETPISAQELWERSTSEGDIEQFYSEIKAIYHEIHELKSNTESLLTLKDENK